ncbi:MAG: putative transrane protein [Marmoricola sp.]|nr:putative transrane protein [Marmoricola sp.]
MGALVRIRPIRDRRRNERGAMAIVVALITCFTLVPMAALAVDIGVQRVARRDAQTVADVVALDLARQLDGRTYAVINPTLQALANQSLARNNGSGMTVTAVLGTVNTAAYDPTNPYSYFTAVSTGVPSAVEVTVNGTVSFSLRPGSGSVSRTSIATASSQACFKIGSYALGLATNQSALNGLLGNALGIGVLGYNGLATSNISLLGLASQLGVGTPDALVNMNNLTIGQLVDASSVVLANTTPHSAANVTLLQTIKTSLTTAGTSGRLVDMGKLLDVGTGGGSGLDAQLNVLDLISGAAFVADGTAAIDVPNLSLSLPGVGAITTSLKVIQPPKIACYGGTATTGQVQLTLDGTLNAGVPLVLTATGPIHLDLGLAVATGTLTGVTCASGVPQSITIKVTQQQAATMNFLLGNPNVTPQQWISVHALSILLGGLTVPLVNIGVSTQQTDTTGTYTLNPWSSYTTTPYKTPQTVTPLPSFTANAGLLGLPLGTLLSPLVNNILNPLVTSLNSLIVNVLSPALGLQVAGVDLFSIAAPPPTCSAPKLVG